MSKQWHPLFAHLLGLLVRDYYDVQPEVPVSDLPRRGDLLLVRRHAGPAPPFVGLWSNLTDWNICEFKGPTDGPEADDLELLFHVGTGITYKLNEERRANQQERLANRDVSFWYLAATLGDTFLEQARGWSVLHYETGGLWRGRVGGHPVWLLSYRDVPVEEDTIPLHLLDRQPAAPRQLGELVMRRQELLQRFGMWLHALQPTLWAEVQHMASSTGIIDWEALGKTTNLGEVVRFLPPQTVIDELGVQRAIEVIGLQRVIDTAGLPRVIEVIGLPRVIEAVGLDRVIEAVGADRLLERLLAQVPAEQLQEVLRRKQQEG